VEQFLAWDSSDTPGDRLTYRVRALSTGGEELAVLGPVDVVVGRSPLSSRVALSAHPNPFNPRVAIEFTLPWEGEFELTAYDQAGRRVARISAGRLGAGPYRFEWDGRDARGEQLASGVYRVELRDHGRAVAQVAVTLVR
jgi:hypothetical protein